MTARAEEEALRIEVQTGGNTSLNPAIKPGLVN